MMSELYLYTPPLASDFAGAAAALCGLGGCTVIDTPSCCLRGYVAFDEPRLQAAEETTATELRVIDLAMGSETPVLRAVSELLSRVAKPWFIAVIGSPVPALTSRDLEMQARAVEQEFNIPSFAISSSGFSTYDKGIALTLDALYERFGRKEDVTTRREDVHADSHKPFRRRAGRRRPRVNILGATPLDGFNYRDIECLKENLYAWGFEPWCTLPFGTSYADVSELTRADVSLVLSVSALPLALRLQREAGCGVVAGCPLGGYGLRALTYRLMCACEADVSEVSGVPDPVRSSILNPVCSSAPDLVCSPISASACAHPRVALVGEQIQMCMLRHELEHRVPGASFTAVILGAHDASMCRSDDVHVHGEHELVKACRRADIVIGDPLLRDVPELADRIGATRPYPAFSGACAEHCDGIMSAATAQFVNEAVASCLRWQQASCLRRQQTRWQEGGPDDV